MKISVTVNQDELKKLVLDHMRLKLGNVDLDEKQVKIETKSGQNWTSEWESGAGFRATYKAEVKYG